MAKQSLSIIIPNFNGVRTIGACLEALISYCDDGCEIVVVDDCSQDGSIGIVEKYPCKLIRLAQHAGASTSRNAGAFGSTAEVLFIIDNDCIVTDTTIPRVRKIISEQPPDVVVVGHLYDRTL
jgi:glycosyltransferase involved in cell wall biosynthesis